MSEIFKDIGSAFLRPTPSSPMPSFDLGMILVEQLLAPVAPARNLTLSNRGNEREPYFVFNDEGNEAASDADSTEALIDGHRGKRGEKLPAGSRT
jgi:hypothetical protein